MACLICEGSTESTALDWRGYYAVGSATGRRWLSPFLPLSSSGSALGVFSAPRVDRSPAYFEFVRLCRGFSRNLYPALVGGVRISLPSPYSVDRPPKRELHAEVRECWARRRGQVEHYGGVSVYAVCAPHLDSAGRRIAASNPRPYGGGASNPCVPTTGLFIRLDRSYVMAKPCKVCSLPPRTKKAINLALSRGASCESVAKRFSSKVSKSGVLRHKNSGHVAALSPEAQRTDLGQIVIRPSIETLHELVAEHWDVYRAARANGELANANSALRELAGRAEQLSILSGEMAQAKAMSLKDVTIDEKLITAFLDAAMARPEYIKVHLYREIRRIGMEPRVMHVTFKDPPRRDGEGNLLPAPAPSI